MSSAHTPVKALNKEHLLTLVKAQLKRNAKDSICDLTHIDVSSVTDMSSLFEECEHEINISTWDVSNVKYMTHMFYKSKCNPDLSTWDVSNVETMTSMFTLSQFNSDISQWDVSKVTNMLGMFYDSKFNGDISKWDVSNVRLMEGMFENSQFNGDISKWNVSKVETIGGMFHQSKFSGDLSQWTLTNLRDAQQAFTFPGRVSLRTPNVFVWLAALENTTIDEPQWCEHFLSVRPVVEALYPTRLQAAKACHQLWLDAQHNPSFESLTVSNMEL